MEKDKILTDKERVVLKSMARYWQEVAEREDTTPLEGETFRVRQILGTRLLFIITRYLELTEE